MSVVAMDLHVHSVFSDGKGTPAENLAAAEAVGLDWLGMVDHVRVDSTYLEEFAACVEALRPTTAVELVCGVEAKILDAEGRLDLCELPAGVDYVAIADHQVPTFAGPAHPAAVRAAIERGDVAPGAVVEQLVAGTMAAVAYGGPALVAHLFSVVPKLGLTEEAVPESLVRELGRAIARSGALVELNERWSCPSAHVAGLLADEGVEFVTSTDSHRSSTIGRYAYASGVAAALCLPLASPTRLRGGVPLAHR